jgi:serum/glucocorticoid-regulated kinase 2
MCENPVPDCYDTLLDGAVKKNGNVSKEDFNLISVIGTGSYGKVLLVKYKASNKLYAMKIIKKKHIKKNKQV